MSTTISREQYTGENHYADRDRRHESGPEHRNRRRRGVRSAFILGAVSAALILGGGWLAFGSGPSTNIPTDGASSTGATSHAVITHPTYQQGQWVASLQHTLGLLYYYNGPDDGVLGPQTQQAIINFQKANGLTPDGVAGPATMALMNHQLITGDNQAGPSGPPVKTAKDTSTKGTSTTGNSTTTPTGGGSQPAVQASPPLRPLPTPPAPSARPHRGQTVSRHPPRERL